MPLVFLANFQSSAAAPDLGGSAARPMVPAKIRNIAGITRGFIGKDYRISCKNERSDQTSKSVFHQRNLQDSFCAWAVTRKPGHLPNGSLGCTSLSKSRASR